MVHRGVGGCREARTATAAAPQAQARASELRRGPVRLFRAGRWRP